jgi:hypothetical protein
MKTPALAFLFAFAASALFAFPQAPARIPFDDIDFRYAGVQDTTASRVYGYVPQGQTKENCTAAYTIVVLNDKKMTVSAWYASVLTDFASQPLSRVLNRDDQNHTLAVMTVSPQNMIYSYWRYGVDKYGQVVGNGVTWNFSGDAGREAYARFSHGKADAYYGWLKDHEIVSVGREESRK